MIYASVISRFTHEGNLKNEKIKQNVYLTFKIIACRLRFSN